MPSLSVCCPVLNEAWFFDLWLKSTLGYADDIVILDGGSTDGTLDIIKKHKNDKIQLIEVPQEGRPYSDDWDEGKRRNMLIDRTKGDFVLMLDADEIIGDNFNKNILKQKFYGFRFVPFWRNIDTVRINTERDPRWLSQILWRLFPKGQGKYEDKKHHCVLECNLKKEILSVDLFHMHYAFDSFGHKPRERDNRRGELGFPFSDKVGKINWEYGNRHPELFGKDWKVATKKFEGQHPRIIKEYFK